METKFDPQSFNANTADAQIVPLTQEDIAKLEKQKKTISFVIMGTIALMVAMDAYMILIKGSFFRPILIITIPAMIFMYGFQWYLIKKINDSLNHRLKHVGIAQVVGKNAFKNSYWLTVEWRFNDLKRVYVTSEMYFSVKKKEFVQLEVLPKTKVALSMKKIV